MHSPSPSHPAIAAPMVPPVPPPIPPTMAPPAAPMTKTYLSTVEAARVLNLSHRTLEKYRVIGGGPVFCKFGRRVVYATADLAAWAEIRRRDSTSDPGPLVRPGRR